MWAGSRIVADGFGAPTRVARRGTQHCAARHDSNFAPRHRVLGRSDRCVGPLDDVEFTVASRFSIRAALARTSVGNLRHGLDDCLCVRGLCALKRFA
jgi:hypothetical protein